MQASRWAFGGRGGRFSGVVHGQYYGALPKYRGDAKLQTWCYRIAVRISLRVSSRQKKKTVDLDVSQLAARNEPAESIEFRDEEARIHIAISGLKAEYRVALCLSLFESLNAGEIADILGVETGAIWTRLHRARRSLAKGPVKNNFTFLHLIFTPPSIRAQSREPSNTPSMLRFPLNRPGRICRKSERQNAKLMLTEP